MTRRFIRSSLLLLCGIVVEAMMTVTALADEPLAPRIDAIIEAQAGSAVAAVADDAEFFRRVYLDFAGRIPSATETRAFLDDLSPEKRTTLIDALLSKPEYAKRMREAFHVQLMERAGEHEEWIKYLDDAFATNKPWDRMVREMLNPNPDDVATRGSAYFLTKRLENYGQQPVDLPGLTRDIGRLFLGVDLQCAQCHDHLFIDDYKQSDFQGLHAFVSHTAIRQDLKFPAIAEKVVAKKAEFMSVFTKEPKTTGPRLPSGTEFDVPSFAKGEEFVLPPDRKTNFPGKPKFSPLSILAEQLPASSNSQFARNAVNRLWWQLMGRGLVHPLDLHHSKNPPSHPEILDLLAREFVSHHFDIKWLLRELAQTRTYQRSSSLPAGLDREPQSDRYVVSIEKPLSTEQMLWSILQATEELPRFRPTVDSKSTPELDDLKKRFIAAFANPPREPEGDFAPSVKSALFLSNDRRVLGFLTPRDGNLVHRIAGEPDSMKVAEEIYIAILSRRPTADEVESIKSFLSSRGSDREKAVGHIIWALISSTEFCVNH